VDTFYLGRQPILDREYKTIAYGLVFHEWDAATDEKIATEKSARLLVHGLMDIGLSQISNNLPVYVPVTRELLVRGAVSEFPPELLGVSIPADLQVDDEILAVCASLRQQGYPILIKGAVDTAAYAELLKVASAVKLDMGVPDLSSTVKRIRPHIAGLIAGRVETHDDFEQAMAIGFTGFQGFFFCRPQIVEGKLLPASSLAVMQALQQVMGAEAISDVEGVMMRDVTLSYRLLRHINAAAFGLRSKVESVRQALGLLGLSNIRQWLSLLLLADAGKGLPAEVVRIALQRAKMLEGIAELNQPERKSEYFLLGLFSLLDTILGISMKDALAKLCLPEAIHQGLTEPSSSYGRLLQLVKEVEHGDWGKVDNIARSAGIKCGDLMGVQTRALHWVNENSNLLAE